MTENMQALWERALELLEGEITPVSFKTWIQPLKLQYMDDKTVYLYTDADIVKNMILARYIDLLKNTFAELTGKEYDVAITTEIPESIDEKNNNDNEDSAFSKYTFENFIVGNSNRFAQAAALAVAESPAAAYNPLFIYGGVGLGKTHLMHAIKNYIMKNNKNAKVAFVSSETFTNDLINALKDKKIDEFRANYRNMDVLLVDDIQFIAGKTATEEEFFHTFNALKDAGSQIVLTSDRPPNEIKTLEERLRSRFEWGLICDIAPPDYETRIAILRQKAQDEKIEIDDSILSFIAERITSNIRELEGVFNRVVAYRGLVKEDITLESVMKVLKDYSNDGKSIVTPQYIVECCARFYSIPPEKFYSTSQKKDVSFARQVSFYLCKEVLNLSYKKIGQAFNRDHSTIIYGIDRIEKEIKKDETLKNSIEMLIKDIKNAE